MTKVTLTEEMITTGIQTITMMITTGRICIDLSMAEVSLTVFKVVMQGKV